MTIDFARAMTADPSPSSFVRPTSAPTSWRLKGRGFVFVFRFPSGYLRASGFAPDGFPSGFDDTVGSLVYADYTESPLGPYRELLLVAGPGEAAGKRALTVPKIYVSSAASAEAGRAGWGFPKERADFQELESRAGLQRIVVLRGGLAEVDATFEPSSGPALPAPAFLLPPSWRTLAQRHEQGLAVTRLGGWGRLRRARLVDFRSVPYLFPDLKPGKPLAGFQIARFDLRLPAAARYA